jgi:hypothetical protein
MQYPPVQQFPATGPATFSTAAASSAEESPQMGERFLHARSELSWGMLEF